MAYTVTTRLTTSTVDASGATAINDSLVLPAAVAGTSQQFNVLQVSTSNVPVTLSTAGGGLAANQRLRFVNLDPVRAVSVTGTLFTTFPSTSTATELLLVPGGVLDVAIAQFNAGTLNVGPLSAGAISVSGMSTSTTGNPVTVHVILA